MEASQASKSCREEKTRHLRVNVDWKLAYEWISNPNEFFRKTMRKFSQKKLYNQILILIGSFLIPSVFVGIIYLTARTKLVDWRVHGVSLDAHKWLSIASFVGFPGLWGEILQRRYSNRKGWKKLLLLSFSKYNILRRNLMWLPASFISLLMYISPAWWSPWNSSMAGHYLFFCTSVLYLWTVYFAYQALPSLGIEYGTLEINWTKSWISKILWVLWWGITYAILIIMLDYLVMDDRHYAQGTSVWVRVAQWIIGN